MDLTVHNNAVNKLTNSLINGYKGQFKTLSNI